MIARTATAQDDATGDGTTSAVLFIGELLQQAERYIAEGVHPRVIADGFDIARAESLRFLESYKVNKPDLWSNRKLLLDVAGTSLRTKLTEKLADQLTQICTDAVMCIAKPGEEIDLHMIERMVCLLSLFSLSLTIYICFTPNHILLLTRLKKQNAAHDGPNFRVDKTCQRFGLGSRTKTSRYAKNIGELLRVYSQRFIGIRKDRCDIKLCVQECGGQTENGCS